MMLLVDLADLGTVTAVAQHRDITSSAVSQQLRVLEEEAGAILFRKQGRALGLTRSGEVLVDHVRRVLGAVDEAVSAVEATKTGASGQVAVGAFEMAVQLFAVPLVRRLGVVQPDVYVQVQQHVTSASLRLLRQGELDLAVICTHDFEGQASFSGLVQHQILVEPLVLLAPNDVQDNIRRVGLIALEDQPWVTGVPDSSLHVAVQLLGQNAGFVPKVRHHLVGAHNVCELVATQIACAVVPLYAVPPHARGLIVDGVTAGHRIYSAVIREGRQRDSKLSLFIRELKAIAADIGRDADAEGGLIAAS